MSKDLFIIAKETSGRSNPIVTALLYTYCPAAAHWYLRNSSVDDVFDVVWKALEDYATGKTMRECLEEYGLSTVIPEIKQYIEQVKLLRQRHAGGLPAPETTILFKNSKRVNTYGLQNQLDNLGGSWDNLLQYVRVWAFMMRDWKTNMKLLMEENATRKFKQFVVSPTAPGVYARLRVYFPVWGWEVTVEGTRSIYLGLLVSNRRQDALRFALINNSDLVGEQSWPGCKRPYLYALDRVTGEAAPMNFDVDREYALNTVIPMYRAACIGPNLPLAALQGREKCLSCGYGSRCFREKGNDMLLPSLNQLLQEDKRERFTLSDIVWRDQRGGVKSANDETNSAA